MIAAEPDTQADTSQPTGELGTFLGTLATLLRETIGRFEQTTDRVSEMVIAHTGRAGLDLVRAIQDFDRLQQELGAVGDDAVAVGSHDGWSVARQSVGGRSEGGAVDLCETFRREEASGVAFRAAGFRKRRPS